MKRNMDLCMFDKLYIHKYMKSNMDLCMFDSFYIHNYMKRTMDLCMFDTFLYTQWYEEKHGKRHCADVCVCEHRVDEKMLRLCLQHPLTRPFAWSFVLLHFLYSIIRPFFRLHMPLQVWLSVCPFVRSSCAWVPCERHWRILQEVMYARSPANVLVFGLNASSIGMISD